MTITLKDLGKRFNRQWIFRDLNYTIRTGEPLAITGSNGSGKSTLLKIISGWMLPSKGSVIYEYKNASLATDDIYRYIDYTAPYTELIEELTLQEFVSFHFSFKNISAEMTITEFIEKVNLSKEEHKQLRYFSSGMKQRLKLGIGFFSETPVLLLDEPTSNLDTDNKKWYREQIEKIIKNKVILIASNQEEEYSFVNDQLRIEEYNSN